MGDRHHCDDGRAWRLVAIAGSAIPRHRPATGQHQHQLSRRLGRHARKQRDPGDRTAIDRPRRAFVFLLDLLLIGSGVDFGHFQQRHQPRHRPGAGAKQGAAGHEPPAHHGADPRRARHQVEPRLPAGRRRVRHHRPHHQRRRLRLSGQPRSGTDWPRAGCGPNQSVRLAIWHAHLARPGQTRRVPIDAKRCHQRHHRAKHRSGRGRNRRGPLAAGAKAGRHRHRAIAPVDPCAICQYRRQIHRQRRCGARGRCRAGRTGFRILRRTGAAQRPSGRGHVDLALARRRRADHRQIGQGRAGKTIQEFPQRLHHHLRQRLHHLHHQIGA